MTHKKVLQFKVKKDDGTIVKDSQYTQNTKMPQHDSYLGFRILGIEDFRIPITLRMIKERGLKDMHIRVGKFTERAKSERIAVAQFAPWSGTIEYNTQFKHKSKDALIRTARHETEHAWQYYLDARNGGNSDNWGAMIYRMFGDLSYNPKLQKEADTYSESIASYTPFYKDIKKYLENLIESLARKVGNIERKKYNHEGIELREQFPWIPKELL